MDLPEKFVSSFKKAITEEMQAMRDRLGPFEVPVAPPVLLEGGGDSLRRYGSRLLEPQEKVVAHTECTLRSEGGEWLVSIEDMDRDRLTISTTSAIVVGGGTWVLVTSTTNAAVDQALDALWDNQGLLPSFESGEVVRIGQTGEETHGAALHEVVASRADHAGVQLEEQRERSCVLTSQIQAIELALGALEDGVTDGQMELFDADRPDKVEELGSVFPPGCVDQLRALAIPERRRVLARIRETLGRRIARVQARTADLARQITREAKADVLAHARVVLATLSSLTINALLQGERFDVVVVEEAGMAVLPMLYYCATLARERVVLIGDPRQLPPIVQSTSDYTRRAMGRSIFEVGPVGPGTMVMLDLQYRMHPAIGELVSRLFYDGRLAHAEMVEDRAAIAAMPPFPGAAVAVVDMGGRGECRVEEGGYSRYNPVSAALCVDLALQAVSGGSTSVAIITPYAAQSRTIRSLLAKDRRLRDVECSTVHRFQGHEKDVVVFDGVDCGEMRPGVLLSRAHLLNVAVSRARGKLALVTDIGYLSDRAAHTVFAHLVKEAVTRGGSVCSSV